MIDGGRVLTISDRVSFQKLGSGEGAVILTFDTGQLHTCNDTTAAFLTLLDGHRTFDMTVDQLSEIFDVERVELRLDLQQLATDLVDEGIVN